MKLFVVSHACVTPVNQEFFAEVQRRTGWEITLVSPESWAGEYGLRHLERWPGFEGTLRPLPVLLSGNIPLHVYRSLFIRLLRREQPDVIYVHHEPYALATFQVYLANALSVRKPIGFFTWQNIRKRYPIPFRWMEGWVYQQSTFACPGSESAGEVLRAKGYAGPQTLMPSGIDPSRYRPSPETDPAIRRELGAEGDEVLFGFLGRIVEEKGLMTLLHALARLPKTLNWRLALIGEGPAEAALETQIEALGLRRHITRRGYVPHERAPDFLSAFDLLVLPSETQPNWKEQFGRVIIEAMACGTPVIGSDSGEIPHLIRRTGGGVVFPERDPGALADALEGLADAPAHRTDLAARGRAAVLHSYTDSTLAACFADTIAGAAPTAAN